MEVKKRKPRRSKEEIELEKIAKQKRKEERLRKKKEKEELKAKRKAERENPPSEKELVHKYVNRIINNQKYHGRIDEEKFKDINYKKKVNKNLWLDQNFYFTAVFQSQEQKHKVLEAIGLTEEQIDEAYYSGKINIINGIELAKKLGIEIELEEREEYPLPELELLPYVLDTESIKQPE